MITPAAIIAGPGVVGKGPEEYGPRYIGAREYASGDGDSGIIEIGEFATIELTPRECYGNIAPGLKFEEKVQIEILSDDTGSAKFLDYENEEDDTASKYISQGGSVYARITADSIGEVKIRASVCDKTVQALAFSGFEDVVKELDSADTKVDCIEDGEDADISSHGYDLRAAEKNIQMYHQLIGRAGRDGIKSTVYFQTHSPKDQMLKDISNEDTHIFLNKEIELRKKNKLPPFERFISLILTGENGRKLEKDAFYFKTFLEEKINARVLGPVSAPIFRLKRKFRIRLLIRGSKSLKLQNSISELIAKYKFSNGIKLTVDVDPINFN